MAAAFLIGFGPASDGLCCCTPTPTPTPTYLCGTGGCEIPEETLSCTATWSGINGGASGSATFSLPWDGGNVWGTACTATGTSPCSNTTTDCPIEFDCEEFPGDVLCIVETVTLSCIENQVVISIYGAGGSEVACSSSGGGEGCASTLTSLTCGSGFSASASFPTCGGTLDVTVTV
jgi:hypothetical protein